MHNQDRADRLAKAIEEMVQGRMPEDIDDEELQQLLQIAKIRLDAANLAAEAGSEAQDTVLERLMARLDLARTRRHEARLVRQFDRVLVTSDVDR